MKEGKQREMAVSCHVLDVLRTVEVLKHVAMKRVLRFGRWQEVSGSECGDPRPTPVEFVDPRHADNFFASSDEIKAITRELITIVWDDTATSNTKAEDAKRVSAGFITGRLSPQTENPKAGRRRAAGCHSVQQGRSRTGAPWATKSGPDTRDCHTPEEPE